MAKRKQLYTDGSCLVNPGGAMGWAALLVDGGEVLETFVGGYTQGTNNAAELTAVITGLARIDPAVPLEVLSDSRYVVDGCKSWVHSWARRGWRKADGEPVKNLPLWKTLHALITDRDLKFTWVRGHDGNPMNERCDRLAVAEAWKHNSRARRPVPGTRR